ncbi:MAG: hypothetical protein HQK51_13775 [Oligoflexia bacterium]|nr:hypothetical protein [Oligoflexia bacterium]
MKNKTRKSSKLVSSLPWTSKERSIFLKLNTPLKIQQYLDSIPYSPDPIYRSPRSVMLIQKAHCFDGALFASAALRTNGYPPIIIDILSERDDDHLLALFKKGNYWGAIAKSNYAGLRYREPIFRNLRELVLSYFEDFYNIEAEKTLRGYTYPINLITLDNLDWMTSDEHLEKISEKLDHIRSVKLFTPQMISSFALVDKRSYDSGMLGINLAGVFRPNKK